MDAWVVPLLGTLAAHAAGAALLAVLVALASHLLTRRGVRHASIAHALWVLVLLKLLTPSFVPLTILPASVPSMSAADFWEQLGPVRFWQLPAEAPPFDTPSDTPVNGGAAGSAASAAVPSEAAPALGSPPRAWPFLLAASVLAGSLLVIALTAVRARRFRRLLGDGEAVPGELVARVAELSRKLGLRRVPRLRVVQERISPLVWPRLGGAELVLPSSLLAGLGRTALDAVLVHELAHLKRRDHWVRLLELATTALFWWHPVAWWARRNLRRFEESCCDAWVAHVLPGSGRDYAEGLLQTLELLTRGRRSLPALASSINVQHDMKQRLTMILQERTPKLLSSWHRALLTVVAVALLVVLPTHADRGQPDAEQDAAIEATEQRYAAQELALERRALELRAQMVEIDAERERLSFEKGMEIAALELESLEKEAQGHEVRGATTEAEKIRLELRYRRIELESRRAEHELQQRLLHDAEPLERALQQTKLAYQEHKIAGRDADAENLVADARARKTQLAELQAELEARSSELHRKQVEAKTAYLQDLAVVYRNAGREDEAAEIEKKMAYLAYEAKAAQLQAEDSAHQRQMEKKHAALLQKMEQAQHDGDEQAVAKIRAALEMLEAEQDVDRFEQQAASAELERKMVAEEIAARLAKLKAAYETASPDEQAHLGDEIKKLKGKLEAVRGLE